MKLLPKTKMLKRDKHERKRKSKFWMAALLAYKQFHKFIFVAGAFTELGKMKWA